MRESRICIDAATGTDITVGDIVERGQQIGVTPEGAPARCQERGVIKAVDFEGDKHRFVVIINTAGSQTLERRS